MNNEDVPDAPPSVEQRDEGAEESVVEAADFLVQANRVGKTHLSYSADTCGLEGRTRRRAGGKE